MTGAKAALLEPAQRAPQLHDLAYHGDNRGFTCFFGQVGDVSQRACCQRRAAVWYQRTRATGSPGHARGSINRPPMVGVLDSHQKNECWGPLASASQSIEDSTLARSSCPETTAKDDAAPLCVTGTPAAPELRSPS